MDKCHDPNPLDAVYMRQQNPPKHLAPRKGRGTRTVVHHLWPNAIHPPSTMQSDTTYTEKLIFPVDPALKAGLRRTSKRLNISQAEIVRRLLEDAIILSDVLATGDSPLAHMED